MGSRSRVVGASALFSAALMASVTVRAAQPFVDDFSFTDDQLLFGKCGSFDIIADGAGTVRLTTYFDRAGLPIRVGMNGKYSGTLTNSVTGAFLVDSPSVVHLTIDLVSGIETHVGTFFNITVPGVGNVYFDAGRLVFDGNGPPIFIAGQQHPPPETLAILCEALQ